MAAAATVAEETEAHLVAADDRHRPMVPFPVLGSSYSCDDNLLG